MMVQTTEMPINGGNLSIQFGKNNELLKKYTHFVENPMRFKSQP